MFFQAGLFIYVIAVFTSDIIMQASFLRVFARHCFVTGGMWAGYKGLVAVPGYMVFDKGPCHEKVATTRSIRASDEKIVELVMNDFRNSSDIIGELQRETIDWADGVKSVSLKDTFLTEHMITACNSRRY
jgi:hypothetical protein